MLSLELRPALEFSISALADVLTRGFEDYFVPIHINDAALFTMMRRDSVDLASSRVLLLDDKPAGVALIARRGWASRLAAMGIISGTRRHGAGTWMMEKLIDEARQRGDHEMSLEVIEQNEAGCRLYKKCGFEVVRRLVAYSLTEPKVLSGEALQEVDIREVGQAVMEHGLGNLPWQLSGETITQHTPPMQAFCLDSGYVLITNPQAKDVTIYSLVVNKQARRQGNAARLLTSLFAAFREKTWHVPALCPEEVGGALERAGFVREELSQFQMVLGL